jgi:tetratricopeptide (TPR) repeat protein
MQRAESFLHANISEIETLPGPGTLRWIPLRRHFDIRAFGINAYSAQAAEQDVVEDHTEGSNGHEELYVVIKGHATFTVAGEEIDAPAGTLVFIRDPDVRRAAKARLADTTLLAIGGKPGAPYEISAWEFWFAAEPHRLAGNYARAVEVASAGLVLHPNHAGLLYNVACYESLAGQREGALEHLKRSIDADPQFRERARSDADFAPLRDDSRFAALTAG